MNTRRYRLPLSVLGEDSGFERFVKITPGPLAGEMKGSLGNTVFSRNKGGAYARTRVVPVNPNSPAQQRARLDFNTATQRWTNILTPAQRASWNVYAAAVPMTDSLGSTILLSGQQHYIRSNAARFAAGLAPVDTAPVIQDTGDPPFGFGVQEVTGSDEVEVAFDDTQAWSDQNGSALLVLGVLPSNPTRNLEHVRRSLCGAILGSSTVPPTSGDLLPYPFRMQNGQVIALVGRICYADGRLSEAVLSESFTVAGL